MAFIWSWAATRVGPFLVETCRRQMEVADWMAANALWGSLGLNRGLDMGIVHLKVEGLDAGTVTPSGTAYATLHHRIDWDGERDRVDPMGKTGEMVWRKRIETQACGVSKIAEHGSRRDSREGMLCSVKQEALEPVLTASLVRVSEQRSTGRRPPWQGKVKRAAVKEGANKVNPSAEQTEKDPVDWNWRGILAANKGHQMQQEFEDAAG
ncbi:hypothetical protein B0T20DRAFT_472983 [Sordaria brevicollis]|uniref:Uncharacterized protein n=1 Tax=Sordaria brevicollis TaxID=83679 RepID=A0AAE0P139_SORBR|nr:hypothetical protein B0T20DRAFT_472983 [Sordaria brevicollis]